ncbi:MAG: hypothetical protein K2J59_04800 [Eubacterium sp.]|nr:hypothetical protein [Eubacterium sp.]
MIKELFKKLKIVLFTKRCDMCGEVVCFDQNFCEECCSLSEIAEPLCSKCGCSKQECKCKKHQKEVEYKAVVAPFYYEGSVTRAILNMKMNEMPKLVDYQGKCVADAVKKYYDAVEFDFVTFVPMRREDKAARGYNQAELLADVVSKECNIPLKDILIKKRKTKVQKRQKASERFANMYNAFDLKKDADVIGRTILLIDDVKTTGATLTSIALTLKAYGAKSVYCAVVAIVK